MEGIEKITAIFCSLLILANAIGLRKMTGTWLFPGCIFSLFWFLYTFFPLVILFEVPVNAAAVAFIALAVILFSSTLFLFNWKEAFAFNLTKPDPVTLYHTRFLKVVLTGSVLISLLGSVMHLFAQGFSISDVLNDPVLVASKFADARYTDQLNYTVFGPISLLFSNLAVIIGGLIYGVKPRKGLFLAFLPSLVILLTQSSKGLFFQSVFLFLGAVMVMKLYAGQLTLFRRRLILRGLLVASGLMVLLAVSFLSRGGIQHISDLALLFDNLRILFATYFFGHLYGFSDWFTAYTGGKALFSYDTSHYYWGYYTFTTFFKLFGSAKVTSPGVFDEYFVYKDLLDSNIYTFFRGMIMDFGLPGAYAFMLLNGWVIHAAFYIFLRRKTPVFPAVFLIFMLEYFYISFIISLLTWNIIPLTFVVCYLILKFNHVQFVSKRESPPAT